MKTAYECKHVKSVRAWGLMFNGEEAGRIVADYSDNPNGAVCTLTFSCWLGPLANLEKTTEKARGYGYDKFNSCLERIFYVNGMGKEYKHDARYFLNEKGYKVIQVI